MLPSGDLGEEVGIQELGYNAALWRMAEGDLPNEDKVTMARFMFGECTL